MTKQFRSRKEFRFQIFCSLKRVLCAGAGVLGIISTFVLPNTLEDLFALAIGGLVGYAALLNLPLRRNDAKEKLQRAATDFAEVVSRTIAPTQSSKSGAMSKPVSISNTLCEFWRT